MDAALMDAARTLMLDPVRERERIVARHHDADLTRLTVEQVRGDIEETVTSEVFKAGLMVVDEEGEIRWDLILLRIRRTSKMMCESIDAMASQYTIPDAVKEPVRASTAAAYRLIQDAYEIVGALPTDDDFKAATVPPPAANPAHRDADPTRDFPVCEVLLMVSAEAGKFPQAGAFAERMIAIAEQFLNQVRAARARVIDAIGIGPVAPGNERLALFLKALARPGLVEGVKDGLAALERAEREGMLVWDDSSR